MHFFVDVDSGAAISGWLVPDNPRDEPHFIVRRSGRPDVRMKANVLREDLRDIGLHATGLAGFRVDQEIIPDLQSAEDVTLIEEATGLPIYRRYAPGQFLDRKFVLVDVSAVPQIKVVRRSMGFFALSYPVIERLPIETIGMVINNKEASSIFISGNLNWPRHGGFVRQREYISAALLRDPFEDLAERLLFISLAKDNPNVSSNRSMERYNDVAEIVGEMDFTSPQSVLRGFRRMAPESRKLFRSPMTAAYGSTPDAELQRRNVSVALDNLAQMDVVGVRPLFLDFASMVDELLAAPVMTGSELDTLAGTWDLATILADIGLVADMLDEDIALYSFACEAVGNGLKIAADQTGRTPPLSSRI